MNGKIHIEKLFPDVERKSLTHKLKIDYESIMYITTPSDAKAVTSIITNHLINVNVDPTKVTITDGTAGVGGDTISFASKFAKVNAIEIDQVRFNYLSNNVAAYGFENVTLYHGDMEAIIPTLEPQDVVFIDPPWGGKNYKKTNRLRLSINNIPLEDICVKIKKTTANPKLIVLKLPANYDIDYLTEVIKGEFSVSQYSVGKMLIVVLE
jgi:16S rRNA G966 N2-methylase RsmD